MLNKSIKFKFMLFKLKWYLIVFLLYFIASFILNKEIEAIIFLGCYILLRYKYPKTFHSKNFYICIFWSIVMMIASIYSVIPLSLSIVSCSIFALLVGFVLYKIKDYIDVKTLLNKQNSFDIKTCTKEELIKRCEEKGFNKKDTEIAIKMFVEKLSTKELSEYLTVEFQSASNKKALFKKRLLK